MWLSARPDTLLGVKRLFDGVLILLVLGTVALGAYAIGKKVDHESNKLSSQDPELNSTTVAAATTHTTKSNETPIIIAVALGGAVVLLILGSAVSSMNRSRKRERWRAG
jgi:hypothetical protein